MTEVLAERAAFDEARETARALVDKHRARLGRAMIRARDTGRESQATLGVKMGFKGTQQVRAYEAAYRDWLREHPGEDLDAEP